MSNISGSVQFTRDMYFTINLGSSATFKLYEECKLKSGQSNDEFFIKYLLEVLAHHNSSSRRDQYISKATQVDILDLNTSRDDCSVDSELVSDPLVLHSDDKGYTNPVNIKPNEGVDGDMTYCVYEVSDDQLKDECVVISYDERGLQSAEIDPSKNEPDTQKSPHRDIEQERGSNTPTGSSNVEETINTLVTQNNLPLKTSLDGTRTKYQNVSKQGLKPIETATMHDCEEDGESNTYNEKNERYRSEIASETLDEQWPTQTMFGCKQCLMYFSKQGSALSHIKLAHQYIIQSGVEPKSLMTEESTAPEGIKGTVKLVSPKIEFGSISAEEVIEAIENQKIEIQRIKDKKTEKISDLKKGKKSSLSSNETLTCATCGSVFKIARTLRNHIALHHGAENVLPKCHICNKVFLYDCLVKRHMILKHSGEVAAKTGLSTRGFLCEMCGSTFTQKHTLKLHMNKHLNVKPYVCKHCGKGFTWMNALLYHERTHTGERPYSCGLCVQRFKTASDRKRHQVVHTKEKPFSCLLCPKKFTQSTTLKTHVSKVHANITNDDGEQSTLQQIITYIPIPMLPEQVDVTIDKTTLAFLQHTALNQPVDIVYKPEIQQM